MKILIPESLDPQTRHRFGRLYSFIHCRSKTIFRGFPRHALRDVSSPVTRTSHMFHLSVYLIVLAVKMSLLRRVGFIGTHKAELRQRWKKKTFNKRCQTFAQSWFEGCQTLIREGHLQMKISHVAIVGGGGDKIEKGTLSTNNILEASI